MTLTYDIDNYHKVFSKYPKSLFESAGRIYGIWLLGNMYKRKNTYHGSYPHGFLDRIYALFPNREKVLHLFSGTIEDGKDSITVDLNPDLNPTFVCNVLDISKHLTDKVSFAVADPPYSKKDAKIYGVPLVNKRLALREIRKVMEDDGILVWLDTQTPIYRKIDWDLLGMIGLFTGTNRIFRLITIFKAAKIKDDMYKM